MTCRYWPAKLHPFVPPRGVFADLGGGTGDIGAGVARALGARVVIVDPTRQMLKRVPADPLVSVRLASAEALPFPDGYFDALMCFDAFHHIRGQVAAAQEIRRVVKPGGGVLIAELDTARAGRLVAVLERFLGEPAAFHTPGQLEAFLAGYGIPGKATYQRNGPSYLFLGSVSPPP
jgi:ubiquinone/menaquinone biosynthesis C-methylase UbiE